MRIDRLIKSWIKTNNWQKYRHITHWQTKKTDRITGIKKVRQLYTQTDRHKDWQKDSTKTDRKNDWHTDTDKAILICQTYFRYRNWPKQVTPERTIVNKWKVRIIILGIILFNASH